MIRGFLACLMLFGFLAGLSVRAMPLHDLAAAAHEHHHHDHHGEDAPCDDGHPSPFDGQPCHKHHHGGCCAPVNLSVEQADRLRLRIPVGVLLGFREIRESPPEEPFLEEDHPPLI